MRLYDSARGAVARFRPRPGQPVTVYVCGITPYDTTHLGHAFTYVVFDVLIRHMEVTHRWPVRYVQNLTDIDDDILRRAADVHRGWRELGQDWTARFIGDMRRLNLRPPEAFPAATGAVPEIVATIARLLAAGRAYEGGGSVYLRVPRGALTGDALAQTPPGELLAVANARGNNPDDTGKENPLDPVLWQSAAPGDPAWHSPWGPGRPGWHIECTAMATKHLGPILDIHGGGDDLRFPHHACERLVAGPPEASPPFVRFWVHTAMVRKDNAKMAKSVGNLVMVSDLLDRHDADTVRLYLLRHPYRVAWEWSADELEATAALTRALHGAMARPRGSGPVFDPAPFGPRFTAALDNDLDLPAAVNAALELADAILAAPAGADVRPGQDVLRTLGGRILGLWLRPSDQLSDEELPAWPAVLTGAPDSPAWSPE